MRYFTFELWNSDVREDKLTRETNLKDYEKQLCFIKDRISKKAFFRLFEKGFHDYKLKSFYSAQKRNKNGETAIDFSIEVTDDFETWEIKYSKVKQLIIAYNAHLNLTNSGFDDWGYQELLAVDNAILSHEILFASGSTIKILFPNCKIYLTKRE